MTKEEILDKAKELVSNERLKHYGPPKENFQHIADLWSVILGIKVSSPKVALCMMALKMARLIKTPDHIDSWTDSAGYAACGGEISTPETKPFSAAEQFQKSLGLTNIKPPVKDASHWGFFDRKVD